MTISKSFLIALLLGLAVAALIQAQDQSGFISIDCGLAAGSSYSEHKTGLIYISDAKFTNSGVPQNIEPQIRNDYQEQLGSLRSFPQGIRNCYKINITSGSRYLIRATFLYGNYDGQNELPQFDLLLGANKWETVTINNASISQNFELIHVPTFDYIQICLANTGQGTPFISAIELRPLPNDTYVTQFGSLSRYLRLDLGSTSNLSYRNLSSSGLKGSIDVSISRLTMLQNLDLSNNSLNGQVPDFLSQLQSLRVLNLANNNLTGPIPSELLQKSNKGTLSLSVGQNPYLCESPPCNNNDNNNNDNKKKSNVVVPVVASVGGVLILLVAVGAFFWTRKRKPPPKTVKMLSASSVQGYQQFQAEVQLLLRVHHRNLTSLIGYCNEESNKGLIYEYMANGNLQGHISGRGSNAKFMTWGDRLHAALDAAQGLEYLHNGCKPPIIHRDVKSTNILLNENFQAKLSDFGLSKVIPTEDASHVSTVVAGTPGYLDPEYYITNRLTEKSDVYSFGVVILEIITGQAVISKNHEMTHVSQRVSSMVAKGDIKNIVDPKLQGDFDTNSVWKVVEIAMACVSPNASARPTMSDVVAELRECLATELAGRKQSDSNVNTGDSLDVMASLRTEFTPFAR
ncbi:hypothetical protein L6164_004320 [Bauhinia variegata]|uniref:Uncharacterized protein n=1 Tax=Bauhinia variegata TaxID=167791 RepID=A0ACB9Q4Q6_BAUVA|nr:hypothetical protein L6164_004320 [Bauhinia variegata]